MAVETEIKFRMPTGHFGSSSGLTVPGCKMGRRSESDLLSTYFDTPKHKLKRRGLLLRVRRTDGKHVQTIKKTSGAQFGRGEWETEIAGRTPDLDEADGTPLQPLARKLRRKLKRGAASLCRSAPNGANWNLPLITAGSSRRAAQAASRRSNSN